MRLLKFQRTEGLRLTEFIGASVPAYAILSHTWEADEDEVTFRDINQGTGHKKLGYAKLQFCARQAAKDGLEYFWVDTCCIDKSSSAELSEAINSMFRWYRDATKCYVYLSDVSTSGALDEDDIQDDVQDSSLDWKSDFEKSRWFTRGWTLQELLAPASVMFFSIEGECLGDKNSLELEIHEVTGIAVEALRGKPLHQFGVDRRFLWAEKRSTKREEDEAYSLLGIFDVYLPLIYGEGRKNAMRRLHKQLRESLEKQERPVDRLERGDQLLLGQSLTSQDGRFRLTLQDDGNLVVTGPSGVVWASNTHGRRDVKDLKMQYDGNLVIYTGDVKAIWASDTAGKAKAELILHSNGNAVMYSDGLPVWSTYTSGPRKRNDLAVDEKLLPKESLVSTNGRYWLTLQADGNLVCSGPSGILWTSQSSGRVRDLTMQADGNLVIYDVDWKALWASMSLGQPRSMLMMQNDGNVVIYSDGHPTWATDTDRGRRQI